MMNLRYHVLEDLHDDYLEPFLNLYQQSFPVYEQVLVSSIIRTLKSKQRDGSAKRTLLCALDDADGKLVGIGWYDVMSEPECAFLWYLAVDSQLRSQGVGSQFYREIVRRATEQQPGLQAVVYEVEIPELAHDTQEGDFAHRRIEFYRRFGAKLCCNVEYYQSVGNWQPKTKMYIMVHPLNPEKVQEAKILQIIQAVFEDAIQPVENLILG
jgi:ribosomal protein S18 acetylase RimI-like enzyme